jgi:Domain of unknown function (DUF4365)
LEIHQSQTCKVGIRMRETHSQAEYIGRRSELIAELFLEDLKPTFLSRPTKDVGLDFLIGFANSKGGINTFGVEVKSTQQPISSSFAVDRDSYRRLANSNVPVCLIVVDAKQNRLFYAWPGEGNGSLRSKGSKVEVPITEINDDVRVELLRKMAG